MTDEMRCIVAAAIVMTTGAGCSDPGEARVWSSATVVLGPLPGSAAVTFEMGLSWRRDCRLGEDGEVCTDVPRTGEAVAGGWTPDDVTALVEEEPGIYRRRSDDYAGEVAFDYEGERYPEAMPAWFDATVEQVGALGTHTVRIAWDPPHVSEPGQGLRLEVERTDQDGTGFCFLQGMGVPSGDAVEMDLCTGRYQIRLHRWREGTSYGYDEGYNFHRTVERTMTIAVQ